MYLIVFRHGTVHPFSVGGGGDDQPRSTDKEPGRCFFRFGVTMVAINEALRRICISCQALYVMVKEWDSSSSGKMDGVEGLVVGFLITFSLHLHQFWTLTHSVCYFPPLNTAHPFCRRILGIFLCSLLLISFPNTCHNGR